MRKLRNCSLAFFLGCCAPLLIWVGAGVALYKRQKDVGQLRKSLLNLLCSTDTDCPSGYICEEGRCVLIKG